MTKRILISLAIIGAVSAIVVGATTAYFSDTETASGNTFTAGTLNLQVGNDDPYTEHITIDNITPSPGFPDWVWVGPVYTVKNIGTLPGKLSIEFRNVVNEENGRREPEIEAGDESEDSGELGEYLKLVNVTAKIGTGKWTPIYTWPYLSVNDTDGRTFDIGILEAGETAKLDLDWWLSDDPNINVVQSDSVEFDIIFKLEQVH